MGWLWTAIGLTAAALAILQGFLIGMQTFEHRRFARSRLRNLAPPQPHGRAALLVPCRGLDLGMEENLRRLFVQDYQDYEIWFILESRGDPAYAVIRRLTADYPNIRTQLIIAGRAEHSGQKVHNLCVATRDLPRDLEYLAFVDADARPAPHWLRSLVARLDRPGMGAATGYRWFIPQRPTLANHVLYALNCNIAMLYSRNGPNVIWGGSWAIRREVFEQLKFHEAWAGTLSDDLVANEVLYRAGLKVEFEPACMVATPLDVTLRQMLSFVRRQYLIGRFYVPQAWLLGFVLITFANLALLGSLAATAWCGATGVLHPAIPALVAAIVYLLNAGRGRIRQGVALRYFPQHGESLRRAGRFDTWAGPLVNVVNWYALFTTALGRQITWRGITYRLFRGGQIALVRRDSPPPPSGEVELETEATEPAAIREAA
jgi:cellulose synthase/poly-beta-1,6-N-acetylglucosamine synthase-like glycosyltransferase